MKGNQGKTVYVYKCPKGHVKRWVDPGGGCFARRRIICPRCGEWAEDQEQKEETK
jgi:hypothetical protein